MSYNKRIQQYIAEYQRDVKQGAMKAREIAEWLYFQKRLSPSTEETIDLLTSEVSDAMRTETTTDSDGRRVRRKHAVRYKETNPDGSKTHFTFWYDMEFAPPGFMQESFQQRRLAIRDDCWQLKQDVDSYNKFYNKAASIQIMLDFRDDMLDKEAGLDE